MTSLEEIELHETASYLYDGGWREEDHDLLMEEYGITSEVADVICAHLGSFAAKEEQ